MSQNIVMAPSREGQKAEVLLDKGSLIINIFELFESSNSSFLKSKHLTKVDS